MMDSRRFRAAPGAVAHWRAAALLVAVTAGLPGALAAQTFTGTGPGATPLFVLTAGRMSVAVESADPRFRALLIGTNGSVIAELTAEPRQAVRVPHEGRYLFDVTGQGAWTLSLEPPDPMTVLEVSGRADGAAAAEEASAAGWLAKGLGAGLILGPIGTFFVVDRAGRSDVSPDADLVERLAATEPAYREEFRRAFMQQRRSDRRAAALVGGLTGTAVLGFVILQRTVWGRGGSAGDGPDPGDPNVGLHPTGGWRLTW